MRRINRSRVAAVVGIAIAQFAAGAVAGRPSDPGFYRGLRQAPFAPPAWVFAPAWAIAKTGAAVSVARVLGNRDMEGRRTFLALAAADAGVYVTFSYVYFRKKSPLLAAVWTCANAAVTAGELIVVSRADRVAALGLAPQAAWLSLATPVALYQAAANPAPVIRA